MLKTCISFGLLVLPWVAIDIIAGWLCVQFGLTPEDIQMFFAQYLEATRKIGKFTTISCIMFWSSFGLSKEVSSILGLVTALFGQLAMVGLIICIAARWLRYKGRRLRQIVDFWRGRKVAH